MKLAMRLPEKNSGNSAADKDPRDDATTEIIDLASRTSYPAVANRKSGSDALGLAAGVGFVALLGAATLWGLNASGDEAAPVTEPVAEAGIAQEPVQTAFVPSPIEELPSANAEYADPGLAPVYTEVPQEQQQLAPAANPYASPTLVFDGTPTGNAFSPAGTADAENPADPNLSEGTSAGDFASSVGGIGGGNALARQNVNPRTTVTQGTMIPAILETAINTDVPGFVRAVVSQDVRSYDGSTVLVPRSSRLVGQYQSGLQAGQKRVYVIWTRLIRPDGVSVSLGSPATGFDGTTGLSGQVNNHFFSRFGSAMLLSVISGLTTIASGGTSVVLGGGQDAATTALQQDGQRPPTIRVRMGEPVRVFTARDLDFSQAPGL